MSWCVCCGVLCCACVADNALPRLALVPYRLSTSLRTPDIAHSSSSSARISLLSIKGKSMYPGVIHLHSLSKEGIMYEAKEKQDNWRKTIIFKYFMLR